MYYFGKCENTKDKGDKVIVMDLSVDNFYGLKKFHMNMSYPKKILDSIIEDEFLNGYKNFRYKKVNIIMGGNATGKTSIGKILMDIFNFIDRRKHEFITNSICDTQKTATFSIDFVVDEDDEPKLYRIKTIISPLEEDAYQDSNIVLQANQISIRKGDSYEKASERLVLKEGSSHNESNTTLNELKNKLGWLFVYPSLNMRLREKKIDDEHLKILNYTLKALDSSIQSVTRLDIAGSYVINTIHHDIIVQDGKVVNEDLLSSGTKAGLDIADILYAIKNKENGFYFCDEKFSYVHSEVEKTFLTLMVELLDGNEQIFFTTHNTDVLDLPFPKHSFYFLRKIPKDGHSDYSIECINASTYLKRNTDSLRNAVENDLFSTTPDLELLYKIMGF